MENKERIRQERIDNIFKAVNRDNPKTVPIFANTVQGMIAYAGITYKKALENPEIYPTAMSRIFDDMYADCYQPNETGIYPMADKAMNNSFQLKIGPDGTSVEHVARPVMYEDEYDALEADPSGFVKNVLIPRMYSFLFTEGIDKAKKRIEAIVEDTLRMYELFDAPLDERLQNEYGLAKLFLSGGECPIPAPPIDTIFDCYRGFKGTQIDLRRQFDKVNAAIAAMWESAEYMPIENTFPFVGSAPHIPAYLSPKQFEKIYWPYYKKGIDYLDENGTKFVILAEHKWLHILDFFRDVTRNSCVFIADDDDVLDVHAKIGDYHTVAGGAKLSKLRFETNEQTIDYAKKVIDTCAPGGGFIFTTDKPWNSPTDINQNLVDVYNFAHEYGRY